VDERDAVLIGREPFARDPQGVLVPVEADEMDAGESLEECFGVSAHAEGGIDEHGALPLERRREQLDAAVEQNGGVDVAQAHGVRDPQILIPIRSDLAPGKCARA